MKKKSPMSTIECAYILDSKPKETENGARKDMVRKLLEGIHRMLGANCGDDYNASINSFDIIR